MPLLQIGKTTKASGAICMVRQVRPGAVETHAQEELLEHWEKLHKKHVR